MRSTIIRLLSLLLVAAGLGLVTAPTTAAQATAPTRVVLEVPERVGAFGDYFVARATVEFQAPDGTWRTPFDGTVEIQRLLPGDDAPTTVATGSSSGYASFSGEFRSNAQYRAVFSGGSYDHAQYGQVTYEPSASTVVVVRTIRKTTLSSERRGGALYAKGTILPKSVTSMVVQYKAGGRWRTDRTLRSGRDGRWSFRVRHFSRGDGTLHRIIFKPSATMSASKMTFRAYLY